MLAQILTKGHSRSCGCLNREQKRQICLERNTKHGLTRTREYITWVNMTQRCHGSGNGKIHKNYRDRGITVCDRWRNDFAAFLEDMGKKPSPNSSIDRIDPSKGYSPDNCRWADAKTQQNNRGNNRLITWRGETKTLAAWSEAQGVPHKTLSTRIQRGWSLDDAMTIPPDHEAGRFMPGFRFNHKPPKRPVL